MNLWEKCGVGASISDNQGNRLSSSSYSLMPKRTVKAPARYRSARVEATTSVDVHVVVDTRKRKNGKSVVIDDGNCDNHADENSTNSIDADSMVSVCEYPAAGLLFDTPIVNAFPDNQLFGGFIVPKCYASLYTKIWRRYGHIATTEVWRGFLPTLLTTVAGLLHIIDEMIKINLRDVKNHELHRWDDMISNCETLRFNIGWLRRRLEVIKINRAAAAANVISAISAIKEEEKSLALESTRVEKVVQDLKVKTDNF